MKILAKAVLNKYKPEIIGITGSVGKTSAREAIFAVISSKFKARQSIKNYNNEIGLPLTVIGVGHQGKSAIGWLRVFLKALWLLIWRDNEYPKILILEMGVDRPRDMEYLLDIVKPKVGVLTKIGESHLEFFKSIDEIKEEKFLLVKNLPKDGRAILNFDDKRIREIAKRAEANIISYGLGEEAEVRAEDIKFSNAVEFKPENFSFIGLKFKISYRRGSAYVFLPGAISSASIEAALAGVAVGLAYKMSLGEISEALKNFKNSAGRMNLLAGIKNTLIVDDTYNSSPQSSLMALDAVKNIKLSERAKKIAVLGDMLELGSFTEDGHRLVGRKVIESGMNELVAVGERARDIGRGALEAGMKEEKIFYFSNSEKAKMFVQERIKEGDLILVKGSQGARMEKIVKEIMAEPLRVKELLVRQGKEWE